MPGQSTQDARLTTWLQNFPLELRGQPVFECISNTVHGEGSRARNQSDKNNVNNFFTGTIPSQLACGETLRQDDAVCHFQEAFLWYLEFLHWIFHIPYEHPESFRET